LIAEKGKMAESKYGRYIVTELRQNVAIAPWGRQVPIAGKGSGGRILQMDNEAVPGSFYIDCSWILPRKEPDGTGSKPHKHDYDEVIAFFGTNLDDPHDLGAEIELWLGNEQHIITRSALVFVPRGLQHCPLIFRRVDRPVFHFTTGPGKMYF
jgi:hypothetical protein